MRAALASIGLTIAMAFTLVGYIIRDLEGSSKEEQASYIKWCRDLGGIPGIGHRYNSCRFEK